MPSGLDARLSYKTCGELPGAGAGGTLRRPLDATLFALPPFHTRDSPLGKGRTDAGGCESEPVPSISYQPISGAPLTITLSLTLILTLTLLVPGYWTAIGKLIVLAVSPAEWLAVRYCIMLGNRGGDMGP